ncbi:hypothetical protein [Desulfolithobacter sp.]
MAAPIPSFFKIRLVVIVLCFCLVFFFLGFLHSVFAAWPGECTVAVVNEAATGILANNTYRDGILTIDTATGEFTMTIVDSTSTPSSAFTLYAYSYYYESGSWHLKYNQVFYKMYNVTYNVPNIVSSLPPDCSGVPNIDPCDDSQKVCECGSVSDSFGLAVVYFDPFKGVDTCADGGSFVWNRDPDQDLSFSSGLTINLIAEPRCFCPGDSDGFAPEVLASPGNLAPLPPGASGPSDQPVDPDAPEPAANCAASCLPRDYMYSSTDGKCICVDSPSAPTVPGLTSPSDSIGNAGGDPAADSDNLRELVDQNTTISNQLADLSTIGNSQIQALNDIAAGVGAFGSQISDSLNSGLTDGLSGVSSSIGDLATNIDGVGTSVDALNDTIQNALDGQFTPPSDLQPYDVGEDFDFVARTNAFIDQMKSTGFFSLPGQIAQDIPTGGDSAMTIEAGQYGTHNFDFADWGNSLAVLRSVCLIVFSWIGIRIVTLKR